MQTTSQQPNQPDLQRPSTDKKTYHSPKLRAAGSVREETAATYGGDVTDGSVTATGGYTLRTMSPL